MSEHFELRPEDLRGPQARALLEEHLADVVRHAPPESCHALDLDALRAPDLSVWGVWSGDTLLGLGALRELDAAHGEVKSMRTAREHLRRGVGAAVLTHLVEEARRRGYTRLSLETGSAEAFVPARGFEEKAHYVGRNVRDHLAAAAENLSAEDSPFLERSVHYASLPPEAVAELADLAREAGQEALVRVNERARQLKREAAERGEQVGPDHRRITFGVYEFDVSVSEDAASKAEDDVTIAAGEGESGEGGKS